MASSAYQAEFEAICPEGWKVVPLTDAVIFQEGPGILAKDFQSSGVPLIRLKGVEGDFVSLEGCNFLAPEKVASKWNHFRLEQGDLVISTSASFGRVSEVTEESAGAVPYTGLIRFQPKTKEIDAGFLRAFLGSSAFMQQVEAMASGSVIRHFGPMHLKQMALPLPPIGEQRAIGNMAKLFAERLRNQSQTNESLEAMARALFKAWFVDFEPVRAKIEGRWQRGQSLPGLPAHLYDLFPDRLVESELGEVPEGWGVGSFSDAVEIIGGGTPKTSVSEYWGGDIPWFSVVDTPAASDVFVVQTEKSITKSGLEGSSARLVSKGATIISARGTVGNLAIAGRDMTFNQSCYALKGKNGSGCYFVFLSAQRMVEQLKAMAHGSVFSTITRQTFEAVRAVLPPEKVLRQFEENAATFLDAILGNVNESRSLAQLRDTLLPKLISGELRVRDAEAFLKERGL